MTELQETSFDMSIDFLTVWDICNVDGEKITSLRQIAQKCDNQSPFRLRISTGPQPDHNEDLYTGGFSIDVFDELRGPPLATIRIPFETLKMIGRFAEFITEKDFCE